MKGFVRTIGFGQAFFVFRAHDVQGGRRLAGRYFALARRGVGCRYWFVNCWPARRCVWPVAAPARAWVRAGDGLRGDVVLLRRGEERPHPAFVLLATEGLFWQWGMALLSPCFAFLLRLSIRFC